MANEFAINLSLSLTRNSRTLASWNEVGLNATQTGTKKVETVLSVTTTAAYIPIPGGTLGYILLKNLDTSTSNEVKILSDTNGTEIGRLGPGEVALWKLGTGVTVPAIKAQTTACSVQIAVFEL